MNNINTCNLKTSLQKSYGLLSKYGTERYFYVCNVLEGEFLERSPSRQINLVPLQNSASVSESNA